MAVYASVANIQSEFKSIVFGATTAVTSDDVSDFITQEETMLETEVSQIYAIPITGTRSTEVMKLMTILMVKARIVDILTVKSGTPGDQGSSSKELRDRVTALLEKILNRTVKLTDATLASSSGGVKSYTVDNDLSPLFTREETAGSLPSQW